MEGKPDNTTTADDKPALAEPTAGFPPDWRERIEIAKRAHEDGKKARKGKPMMFRLYRPLKFSD